MDLEHELLGAYLKSDSGTNPVAQALANTERPFYELGKIYSVQYLKKPQAIFTSPELKDIRKKVFGYLCSKIGEAWYEQQEDKFMESVMNYNMFMTTPAKLKKAFKKELTDLFDNIRDAYFNALTEFSIGFWEGASKKTWEWTIDMLFWFMPDDNVSKFNKLLRTPDTRGMISLYHDNEEEINKARRGARKFMKFVESGIKKQ